MSTRSATNPRTQNREYTGATRKSAASAKPARSAASSVRVVPATAKERRRVAERGESLEGLSKEEKRARKREQRAKDDRIYSASNIMLRADEDYKKRRRIFWGIMIGAVACILITWVLLSISIGVTGSSELDPTLQIVLVVLVYAFIIAAFVFDLVRIRPLRNYYRTRAEGMSDARINELLEQDARAEAAKKRKRGGSGKKKAAAKAEATAAADEGAAEAGAGDGAGVAPAKKRPKKNQRSRR